MAATVGQPAQVSSDDAGNHVVTRQHSAGVETTTQVFTLHKITKNGTDGSVTFVNGKQTAQTLPT